MGPGDAVRRIALAAERTWDRRGLSRSEQSPRFEAYLGHGDGARAVVRGRLLLGKTPEAAQPGEHAWVALRRTVAAFTTTEVPRERVRVRLGQADVWAVTDDEGYLEVTLEPALTAGGPSWREGSVTVDGLETPVEVRVPSPTAAYGVISDLDDTIVETGVLTPMTMLHRTLTGSALTRRTFDGAPELYRALAAGPAAADQHPFFYVSSSPWNLHSFLAAFLEHRGFPRGPLQLRDLLGSRRGLPRAERKRRAIAEILDLHPGLRFVLIGDSGEEDERVYAEVVREHPGRVLAVYIHEVRPHPGDDPGRASADWPGDLPVLVTRDFVEMHRHAVSLGLAGHR